MNLKYVNNDPMHKKWEEQYNTQPQEIREKLDKLRNINPNEFQLKVIKGKRTVLMDGDIFVLSPQDGIYFYGKVMKANIQHISGDAFINGQNLVFIFKCKSKEATMENYEPDYDNLLIEPSIVGKSYWTSGYFYTIGNEAISEVEKNLDYGFYKTYSSKVVYYKENGVEMDHQPLLLGPCSIKTITGIAYYVTRELILNPSLLIYIMP
jgi:hypothetical protein